MSRDATSRSRPRVGPVDLEPGFVVQASKAGDAGFCVGGRLVAGTAVFDLRRQHPDLALELVLPVNKHGPGRPLAT